MKVSQNWLKSFVDINTTPEDLSEKLSIGGFEVESLIDCSENVKGITAGEAKKKLNEFINAFQNIGYDVTYKVMNAAHYGVPQARERTMFVCVREDVCEAVGLNFMTLNNEFPEENKEMVT